MAKAKLKLEDTKRKRKREQASTEDVADPATTAAGASSEVEVQGLVERAADAFPQHSVTRENSGTRNILELSFTLGATKSEDDGQIAWYQPEISDTIKNVVSSVKALVKAIGPSLTIRFRIDENAVRLRVIESNSQRDFDFQGGSFEGCETLAAPQAIAKAISDTFASISTQSAKGLEMKIAEKAINPAAIDFARAMSKNGVGITVKSDGSETDIPVPALEKIPMRARPVVRDVYTLNGTITARGSNGEYYLDSGEVRFKSNDHYEIGTAITIIDAKLSKAREMKIAESFARIEVLQQIT